MTAIEKYRQARAQRDQLIDILVRAGSPDGWKPEVLKALKASETQIRNAIAALTDQEFSNEFKRSRSKALAESGPLSTAVELVEQWIKEAN